MSKGEKILRLMKYLEELDDEGVDKMNISAEACLIVQSLKKATNIAEMQKQN